MRGNQQEILFASIDWLCDAFGMPEDAKPKPRKSKALMITIAVIVFIFIVINAILLWPVDYNAPLELHNFNMQIVIKRGASFRDITSELKKSGLIKSSIPLWRLTQKEGTRRQLKPGIYSIESGITLQQLHDKLIKGAPVKITIPPGYRAEQVQKKLEDAKVLHFGGGYIKPDYKSVEGYFWPETYYFVPGDNPERAAVNILTAFNVNTYDLKKEKFPSGLNWEQIITLASMIEKETGLDSEKALISSVYHNRLKKNMVMNCDATVRYGLKKWSEDLTLADLRSDDPYNSYKHKGLPPTPICSPGLASIKAAIHPAQSDFLFYCAKDDKSHVFAKTYKEHQANVEKYLR